MITKERSNRQAVLVLLVLGGVLAYTTFQWGGVVRTGRYQYLLVLGLLAMLLSLGRSRDAWSPLPDRVLRWTAVLLPAYVLLQVVPLPVAVLRVLSPARAEAMDALGPVGAKVSFASLSVFPAGTFQYFLLVCGYIVIFLLTRHTDAAFWDRRWLVIWPILGIAALEAGLGLWQYFGGTGEQVRWGTYANHNHYAGFLEMSLPFAMMYPVAVLHRAQSRWHSSVARALAASGVWALALLMFSGIILSFSRMGFIATLSSLFVMGSLVLGTTKLGWVTASRRRRWIGIGMVAALVLAGFVFLPPERLIQRFAEFVSTDGLTGGLAHRSFGGDNSFDQSVSGLRLRAWRIRDCIFKVQEIRDAPDGGFRTQRLPPAPCGVRASRVRDWGRAGVFYRENGFAWCHEVVGPEGALFRGGMCRRSVRDCAAQFGGFQLIHSCECDAAGVDRGNGRRIAGKHNACKGAAHSPEHAYSSNA